MKFKRTKGTINYKKQYIDNPDRNCKWVRFNFDEQGTFLEIFLNDIDGLSDKEIIDKAISKLVNFDDVIIRDCHK